MTRLIRTVKELRLTGDISPRCSGLGADRQPCPPPSFQLWRLQERMQGLVQPVLPVWSPALGDPGIWKGVCCLVRRANLSFVIIKAPAQITPDRNDYLLLPINSPQKEITSTKKRFKGFSSSLFFFPKKVVISLSRQGGWY